MSIFIDAAQKFILHKAYKFTNSTAVKLFKRYANTDLDKSVLGTSKAIEDDKCDLEAPNDNIVKPEPRIENKVEAKPKQKVKRLGNPTTCKRYKVKRVALTERDMPRCNSGPIDPPQNPCMQIIRDSYFS